MVDLTAVEVLDREPYEPAGLAGGSWPCPGCGETHSLTGAVAATIRNRAQPRMQRRIVLCSECAERIS